jgi:carboxypeptidase Taq
MLRFDLENELLEGKLSVKDLPEAWREAMQADVGIEPSDDRDGCLQDAHWYSGYIGGRFQSYAIGNILSAQFYAAALKAHPYIPREIASGEFRTLNTWLRDNLYRHGSKFVPNDLVERATGAVMQMRRRSPRSECTSGRNDRAPPGLWRAVGENAGRANRQRS